MRNSNVEFEEDNIEISPKEIWGGKFLFSITFFLLLSISPTCIKDRGIRLSNVNKLNSVGQFKPLLFRRYVEDCFASFHPAEPLSGIYVYSSNYVFQCVGE